MIHIKTMNEYFDTGAFGDTYGYGGANGVLKINYKPFNDLSVQVGQDPDKETTLKGSEFQLGDVVITEPLDSKKKVIGVIVRSFRNSEGDGYRYFIQVYNKGKKTERVIEVKSNVIEFAQGGDHGNMEAKTKIGQTKTVDSSYNSKTVYNSNDLGLETVGG